ncbi:MAG: hypothetical protein KDA65_17815 [Planctomycetaceae bacterium]|nr:hypothetical protein [Planctomycetaceae bacterium]
MNPPLINLHRDGDLVWLITTGVAGRITGRVQAYQTFDPLLTIEWNDGTRETLYSNNIITLGPFQSVSALEAAISEGSNPVVELGSMKGFQGFRITVNYDGEPRDLNLTGSSHRAFFLEVVWPVVRDSFSDVHFIRRKHKTKKGDEGVDAVMASAEVDAEIKR